MHATRLPRVTVWQIVLAGALAVAGFLTATQIHTERLIRQHLNVPSSRLAELASLLQEQERRRALLEAEIADLQLALVEAEHAATAGAAGLARLNRTLQTLRAQAGLLPLEGPGVLIEMRDSTLPFQPGDDPNKTILHYTDLHSVINDLWAAGAEAIAVNDERITVQTGVNCVGTTILCNTKRIAPPYRIVAIGPPDELAAYVRRPGGAVEILTAFSFPVHIRSEARVAVPAYRGILQFNYARPATTVP